MNFAPALVEAQPRQALPFGLFSVLTLRPPGDNRVFNGVEWQAMTCAPASGFDDPGCGDALEPFFRSAVVLGEAAPFVVYATDLCGAPAGPAYEDGVMSATTQLLAREEAQAERFVWDRLAAQAADVHPSGALPPALALAALERWLGEEYGSLGVVHADRGTATLLDTLVAAVGSRLATRAGSPVVAGGGYPATSPGGDAPADGEAWLMASPPLFGYRGEVEAHAALDHRRNDHYAVAQRPYVVGFDPCGVAAVRVSWE